jgi:transposase
MWYAEGMRAYSHDLRQRVLHAVDHSRPRAEIVKTFDVSLATLKRYLKQRRETGYVISKPIPGRPAKKGGALDTGLEKQLQAHPDATLQEHCQLWETAHGMQVSSATMSRAMQRVGWPRKKDTDGQ